MSTNTYLILNIPSIGYKEYLIIDSSDPKKPILTWRQEWESGNVWERLLYRRDDIGYKIKAYDGRDIPLNFDQNKYIDKAIMEDAVARGIEGMLGTS